MVRRTIAVAAGLVVLAVMATIPSPAGAQEYVPPPTQVTVSPTSVVRSTTTTTVPEETTTTEAEETTTTAVLPDSVVPTTAQVKGDVVSRPLPRTGSDLNGTAIAGGALTIAGIGIALTARRRRNAYEGS